MSDREPSLLTRSLQGLVLLLATAATLRAIDWWPRTALESGRVHELPTLEAVERAAGRHLALPSWFPATLPWPPSRIRVVGTIPSAVALELGPEPRLVLAESVRAPVAFPPEFFPAALELERRTIPWRGGEARLTRLRGEDGATWVELAWEQDGQAFAFRTRGSLEQLIDLAASVHREGP